MGYSARKVDTITPGMMPRSAAPLFGTPRRQASRVPSIQIQPPLVTTVSFARLVQQSWVGLAVHTQVDLRVERLNRTHATEHRLTQKRTSVSHPRRGARDR